MQIIINDCTLRDGNHAAAHKITKEQIIAYARFCEKAKINIVEVGHGNGLGASSLQLGKSFISDKDILITARNELKNTKLGIHFIPGFGKLADLNTAVDLGVDVFRIASHCTEADTTKRYIDYLHKQGKQVYGVLMMSHMAEKEMLLEQSKLMVSYGAQGIILMDSAGSYLPDDVKSKVAFLYEFLKVPIGFHAHNNLGMAVANSIQAISSGANIIDVTIGGYGAGAGNTPLELLVAALMKMKIDLEVNIDQVFSNAGFSAELFYHKVPVDVDSIISGLFGIFSGFLKPVKRLSTEYNISAFEIYKRLSKKKVIAGQEDLIIEVVKEINNEKNF